MKDNIKLWWKIYFGSTPIAYGKFFDFFNKAIEKFGLAKNDLCEYRLTQVYDELNQPTEQFYYSNKSLGPGTTYIPCTMKEFTSSFNLEFVSREKNNGLFKKKTKTKLIQFWGKKKLIVNSPYMIEIKFGDYIAVSNGLIMVIPRKLYKNLFKWLVIYYDW